MLLPEILNTPFEITLGETKILVKKASVKDLGLMQQEIEKNKENPNSNLNLLTFGLMLCIKKAYPDSEVKEEYVQELVPLAFANSENYSKLMIELGFFQPTKINEEKKIQ